MLYYYCTTMYILMYSLLILLKAECFNVLCAMMSQEVFAGKRWQMSLVQETDSGQEKGDVSNWGTELSDLLFTWAQNFFFLNNGQVASFSWFRNSAYGRHRLFWRVRIVAPITNKYTKLTGKTGKTGKTLALSACADSSTDNWKTYTVDW